jgi:hypothetical protein
MNTLDKCIDLEALFGLDIDTGQDVTPAMIAGIVCGKCKGSAKFVGRNGKVLGPCFACNGEGVSRSACVTLTADDCVKCAGSGEWRPGMSCFGCKGTGSNHPTNSAVIDVSAIATAFNAAYVAGIKRPKLRLDTFTFSRAPDTGHNAGSIYVKSGDEYLGKVTNGAFHPAQTCDAETTTRVIAVASKPHEAAKAYGMKTKNCSCCGKLLRNGISVQLGIGPICRDKFGW